MKFLLSIPFQLRVMIFLCIITILWWIIGKRTIWLLSVIPFIIKRFFFLLYQIIAFPIAMLHKRIGSAFFTIDNCVASIGAGICSFFENWYQYWRFHYKFHWGRMIIVYLLCFFYIIVPSVISIESDMLKKGEEWYLRVESVVLGDTDVHAVYDSNQKTAVVDSAEENGEVESKISQIELMVAGVNSSLLVRDIPNMEEGIALERLYNEDVVVWNGELVFAKAEEDRIEAWVKVRTETDVVGWSRLYYLHPVNYEKGMYYVNEEENR